MTLVALQPSASPASRKHFRDTVATPVRLDLMERFLPAPAVEVLRRAHPSGEAQVWGVRPGERSQQVPKWSRLRPGDYIAFAADGRLFAGAVLTSVFRSDTLAKHLWGSTMTANGAEQTWELMFSLARMESLAVPYSELNRTIGRAPGANVQEFAVLGEGQSEALLTFLNRTESSYGESELPPGRPPVVTAEFDQTDREVTAKRRVEQRAIKIALTHGPTASCELCGRSLSVEFLTAAHIKRRSLCTDDERIQLTAVAMLNCRFGCDELFGKGYVGVDPTGVVRVSDVLVDAESRTYALERLAEKRSTAWSQREETRAFFAYHWLHDFRRPVAVT